MATFNGLMGNAKLEALSQKQRYWLLGGGLGAATLFYIFAQTDTGQSTIDTAVDTTANTLETVMNWLRPIDGAHITSPYGPRAEGFHDGVDFGVPENVTIRAPFDGKVVSSWFIDPAPYYPSPNAVGFKKWLDANGKIPANASQAYYDAASGNAVILESADGQYRISFAHMNRRDVTRGTVVKQGDSLGVTGNTGMTTGPHAHVVLRVKQGVDTKGNPVWARVDPMSVDAFKQMFA